MNGRVRSCLRLQAPQDSPQACYSSCYTLTFGNGQGSLNAPIHGFIHSTSTHWDLLCAGPGGRHFTNFSNLILTTVELVNSHYTDEIKLLSGYHSPMALWQWVSGPDRAQWQMTLNMGQVLVLLPEILQARKGLGSVLWVCMCVCRERALPMISARTFPLLQPRVMPP